MTRDEIVERLPFYANGTLTGEEQAEIRAALEQDDALREELMLLEALRDRMQEEPVNSPGEAGLTRLMDKLDQTTPANLPRAPRIWQIAASILLAVAVLQGVLLMSRSTDEAPYRLAGDGDAAITASFRPDVTEAELRAALLAAGLVIVDGPSALGLYGLAPLEGQDIDAARAVLLESNVVEGLQ